MSRRVKLVEVLNGDPGQVFSGEALARRLGISRTAVWKQIQSLRNSGFPIESTGRQGYRLTEPLDSSLAKLRSGRWGVPHYFLHTPSTQTLAKAGAAAGLPEGHFWMAETQSKGRGRLDRRWESGYGGLWFSLLLRPKIPASRVPPLTLLAGQCLTQAVEKVCRIQTKLKWPNDLLVLLPRPKKLAGILTEMSGQLDRTDWVVVGIGLNVNNLMSKELSKGATSLYGLTGKAVERAQILDAFLHSFHPAYVQYQKEGFEPFRRTYWSLYFAPEKNVRIKTGQGTVQGRARGVDASGAIMIESRRKIETIFEGDIVL